jgi:hypothetical protein
MKKKYSKVNTSSGNHIKFQTRKEKKTKKKKESKNRSMNNSVSLTPVQGPSTVVCMTVTFNYHNFPTDFISSLWWVKASEQHQPVNPSFCCKSGTNGKTRPYYWLATDHNDKKQTDRKGTAEPKGKDSRGKQ